jgi:hypothetical protein
VASLAPKAADEVALNALVALLPRQGLLGLRQSADELLAQPFGQVAPVDRTMTGGAQQPGAESLLTRLLRSEVGEMVIGAGGEIPANVPRLAQALGHLGKDR